MNTYPELKMLAVVVVLFMVAGGGDSVVLNKCEVKAQLEAAVILPQNVWNQTTADLLAKIVCHVQLTSGFNTSAIKITTNQKNGKDSHGSNQKGRKGRSVGSKKNKGKPSANVSSSSSEESSGSSEEFRGDDVKTWTLYGLFQLGDRVVCNSTSGPSLNLCGISCSSLTDNDIRDDLACVQVLINKMTAVIPDPSSADLIHKMLSLIYQKECANMVASTYFSDCK